MLGFRAQCLYALLIRLRGQCGYCGGNFGQGALLGRRARGGQSEDLVLDQISAQGGKGTQEDQGCNVGWEHQKASGFVFWGPRDKLWLLSTPRGTTR